MAAKLDQSNSKSVRARSKNRVRALIVAGFSLALAGCGGYAGALSTDLARLKDTIAPRDLNVFQRRAPLTAAFTPPEELIGADGRCASDPPPAAAPGPETLRSPTSALAFTAGPDASSPPPGAPPPVVGAPDQPTAAPVRGVALDMTECDVVRVAGYTNAVEISANENGQRAVVLTYASGPRPGIYRFVSGRLVSIERGPEPPPAQKPAKPAKKKKQARG